MKNFVRIQSEIDIQVTAGLQSLDATNYKSPQADRLSIKPAWTEFSVVIRKGLGYYPSEIKNWDSVKTLAEKGLFTIGEEVDEFNDDPNGIYPTMEKMLELKKDLLLAADKYEKNVARIKKANALRDKEDDNIEQ